MTVGYIDSASLQSILHYTSMKSYFVYILTNKNKTTLYIGLTNDLVRRLKEHTDEIGSVFTKTYQLKHLIYFEKFEDASMAISREKQIKRWSRFKKNALINSINPEWRFMENELI
jgi:putative endonuclease